MDPYLLDSILVQIAEVAFFSHLHRVHIDLMTRCSMPRRGLTNTLLAMEGPALRDRGQSMKQYLRLLLYTSDCIPMMSIHGGPVACSTMVSRNAHSTWFRDLFFTEKEWVLFANRMWRVGVLGGYLVPMRGFAALYYV